MKLDKEIKIYDKNGNLVYYKNPLDIEEWYDYDDKGNEIHYKSIVLSSNSAYNEIYNDGFYEVWTEYDERGNDIHSKNSDGDEYWNEYDSNNNLICHKDSDGNEKIYKNNKLIYNKDSSRKCEEFYEYDENGNAIKFIRNRIGENNG